MTIGFWVVFFEFIFKLQHVPMTLLDNLGVPQWRTLFCITDIHWQIVHLLDKLPSYCWVWLHTNWAKTAACASMPVFGYMSCVSLKKSSNCSTSYYDFMCAKVSLESPASTIPTSEALPLGCRRPLPWYHRGVSAKIPPKSNSIQ